MKPKASPLRSGAKAHAAPKAIHARRGGKAADSAKRPQGHRRKAPVNAAVNVVEHAVQLLDVLLLFERPADTAVSAYFKVNPGLGHRDRGLIAEGVYGVLRRKLEYAQLAQSGTGALSRRMVLLGLADTAGVEPIAATLDAEERTWLRRVATVDRSSLSFAVRTNFPPWLLAKLGERFDEPTIGRIAAALNTSAPLDLRVNTMRTTRYEALAALRGAGLPAEPTALAPNGIRLGSKPALGAQQIFVDGRIEVQDEGSQLLATLVAPKRGELVIDFCAGAGGKTLALGDLMRSTGRLYAFDVSVRRLSKLKPRLARSGLSNVHPVAIESERDPKLKRMAGKADRVLVDAPCSGLGTLRRNPDLKWRQTPESVAELTVKQGNILAAAARLVKPGGRLVYATCSLLVEENRGVVDTFLGAHAEFEVESATEVLAKQGVSLGGNADAGDMLELWTQRTGTDGFFAAVLKRRVPADAP